MRVCTSARARSLSFSSFFLIFLSKAIFCVPRANVRINIGMNFSFFAGGAVSITVRLIVANSGTSFSSLTVAFEQINDVTNGLDVPLKSAKYGYVPILRDKMERG